MVSTIVQSEPIHLISPERAKLIIGQFIEAVSDRYNIIHSGNSTTIEGIAPLLLQSSPPPQLLFCASMWSAEEQVEIQSIARTVIDGISTFAIPTGMQVREGPAFVLNFLIENVDNLNIPQRQ